ncbi:hypothetical protein [Leifsonia soli]|uniref:Glucan phosphoethanolaminetransferase (Alkaline phosphatase superfamily) n=1 Tax=Leifsonia soli TaxID=582665 RepID=A0A852T4P0_9MICO|nr:hypothetical protein [Leifsonia soli]NYD75795.1 glucan phosphoethanolaminetransferase (alkaline phosphatase superfamily) [Leifsonia soli]
MVTEEAGKVQGAFLKRLPRGLRIGFALLVLVGVVEFVQITINAVSGNASRLLSAVTRNLTARPNGAAAIPIAVAFLVLLVLAAIVWAELPVLFGWLALRGRKWSRIALTVVVGLGLAYLVGSAPYDFVLDGIQLAAVVLLWLPSATVFISAENKRRKRSKRDHDANALLDPGGRLPT